MNFTKAQGIVYHSIMKRILVTGFKEFNHETINPSLEVLKKLIRKDVEMYCLALEVEYDNDYLKIENKIKECQPDYIILLGQAGRRSKVSLEYFALNMQSGNIKDNQGKEYYHHRIDETVSDAYHTQIDLVKFMQINSTLPCYISYHAGTFICNEIYFRTLNYLYSNHQKANCLFVHLPFLKSQVEEKYKNYVAFMELDTMLEVINKLIDFLIKE